MTSTGKNSPERSDYKTNYFLPLECDNKTTKRSDAESKRASKMSTPTVEMYLRIRPTLTTIQKSYAITNSRTVLTFLPSEDRIIRNLRCPKSSENEDRRHAFTKIFGSETSQAEMFEGSIKHRVAEFLGGKSSTIMTYGMRDSGKTYTLFGTCALPGIITRSIDLVFSVINCTIEPWYKSTFRNAVFCLNEIARASEMHRKTRVLNGRSTDVKQTSAEAARFLTNSQPVNEDPDEYEECYGESMYAVWLSFAEIYNGNVYDLLDDAEIRSPLRLYVNTKGRAYVCGLQKVHVVTALEACEILVAGRSRMSAATSRSSRSHTIFTMELLRYQKDCAAKEVVLSTLTFCDLASSTQFEQSHVREASSINNSLLVLCRCLKAVSQNRMAPFRQSNLTRICQRALSVEENLSVIVNVTLQPSLSDETQSIFNFCDIVRKLLNNQHRECKQFCESEGTVRYFETYDGNITASSSSHQNSRSTEIAETTGCTDSAACRNIREQNRKLQQELKTVKSNMLNCENTILQQLSDHYLRIIEELEGTYKENTKEIETEGCDLLKWSVEQIESFYNERIDNLIRYKKRKRGDSGDYIVDNRALYEELEAENEQVISKVMALKEMVKKLSKENKTILCEKNKCSFELALVTEELKKFRQLTRSRILKWGGNGENIEDGADCLMNNLEQLMNEKMKRTEKKLEEMGEYVSTIENKDDGIASGTKQKLSKSEDLSTDTLNKMKELEEELLRKEACIIRLQHHTQLQERQFAEIQRRLNEKNGNISDRKCKYDRSASISFDDDTTDSSFRDNTFAEKNSSRMCMNSSTVDQREFNDWIIVPTLLASHGESMKKKLSDNSNVDRRSIFENSGRTDCNDSRLSDRNSKNDSGVSSESRKSTNTSDHTDHTSARENEDKSTQTYVINKISQNSMAENVEQLKNNADLKKWNYQETLQVAELSHLETTRDVIIHYTLNEAARSNECQLLRKEGALKQLTEVESEIAIKRNGLFKMIENKMKEYKREIRELIRKLAVKEENESRIFKCLERYTERSRAFENKLSLMRNRLDRAFNKCANEHLPQIENLEKEMLQKTLQINELEGRIANMQHEFAEGYELFQKINDFEIVMNRCQRDKNELCRQLYECSEIQLTLDDKLKKLAMKMTERESEVILLKSEVRNIAYLNIGNNKKAKNLSEKIIETNESIGSIKEDLQYCEDLRKNVENTVQAEIYSDHKNNTIFLNEICKTYGDSQNEITLLKMQLEHKELEVTLLKANRDATIKKYEILMRHFQNEIEEKNKHFETVANSSNNLKKTLTKNQREPKKILKDYEAESSFASNFYFVPKYASSEILNVSPAPSEDFTTFVDEKDDISIKFDDDEACQTDSSVRSNIRSSICETDSSVMEGNFNMKSPSTKDKKNILEVESRF